VKRGKVSVVVLSALAVALSASVFGCAKPSAELKRAKDAIADARRAGAADYAPADLAAAEKALSQGKEQMDNMSYEKAKASFEQAYRLAIAAQGKAPFVSRGASDIFKSSSVDTGTAMTEYPPPSSHSVREGECLWRVSEYSDIYNDPFQWPLIYDANRAQINKRANASGLPTDQPDGNAHWIFPGQQFDIPRDASTNQIKNARSRAGAPTPYMPPGQ